MVYGFVANEIQPLDVALGDEEVIRGKFHPVHQTVRRPSQERCGKEDSGRAPWKVRGTSPRSATTDIAIDDHEAGSLSEAGPESQIPHRKPTTSLGRSTGTSVGLVSGFIGHRFALTEAGSERDGHGGHVPALPVHYRRSGPGFD
jgi:hypothetical protein